ncbi:MAG: UDP-glucose 4-epimerase GalE [Deltaproteobacteria bacterium HGW-Deltaproteobacteria-8]|nr:MAG: UDP-glucose 4-epimerase GalE [Deltaproteobacteria bacterium HGW-Deltaproteobacteria-8]
MSKNILVTGGAGYIGSHTCKVLAQAGYTPVTLDNLVYGHEWAVRFGPFVQADVLDRAALDRVFAEFHPSAVLHFAAFTYVGESVTDPGKYYRNNAVGTLTLLEAMRDHGCGRLVFSSSCAVYGLPQVLPLTEEHPQAPMNSYGVSKAMSERMMADFGLAHGLRSVCLRYFNAAGADPGGLLGEDHDPETHLIPLAVEAALGKRPPLQVFGSDYPTPDGTAVRDYVHVLDLAQAHVAALRHLEADAAPDSAPCAAFNLGTGQGASVAEVLAAVKAVSGRAVPHSMAPRRAGDPPMLVAQAGLAERVLGWRPAYTDIKDIIRTAWDWHARERASLRTQEGRSS